MTPVKFNNWLKELDHLTDEQKQKLKSYLKNQAPEKQIIASIEQRLIDKPERYSSNVLIAIVILLIAMAGRVICKDIVAKLLEDFHSNDQHAISTTQI